MIEINIRLPLARFELQVHCTTDARVTALVGPSGSGKTSLVETIAGLRPNARGSLVIDGVDVAPLPPERRGVGYVPQDVALFPHLSARRNITFASKDRAHFDLLVETLALEPLLDRPPASLSGGERQRVALARALMMQPRLLLLDEPLASIDQPLREKILLYLRRIRDLGVPMIYVTHQPFEAMALAGECIVLRDGSIAAQGSPADVLYELATEVDNVFEVAGPRHDPEKGITSVTTTDGLPLVLPYDAVRDAEFPLVVRISGEEVVVFGEEPVAISSRNVIEGTVTDTRQRDGRVDLVIVPLLHGGKPIHVRVTRAAADELALAPGRRVWLAMRSRAFRIVG
jgi:molybdate transport system ATP-binding protein